MKLAILGGVIIVLGFVWMFSMPFLGYDSPLFFRWSDFKPILGITTIGGAVVLGLGVMQIKKAKKQQAE